MKSAFAWLFIMAGLLALVALALSGPAYQYEILSLQSAFLVLRYAAFVGAGAAILCLLMLIFARPKGATAFLLVVSLIAGGVTFYLPYAQYQTATSVPAIHDISTDTENPPAFVAIAPLRADAPNPVEYAGEETAQQQREAYPQIQTQTYNLPANEVFELALDTVDVLGWQLVASDVVEGRIEATDTTQWFGFKDDIVIRIEQLDNSSQVDVRSKSRVGRSDVGVNAKRIETFLSKLENFIEATTP